MTSSLKILITDYHYGLNLMQTFAAWEPTAAKAGVTIDISPSDIANLIRACPHGAALFYETPEAHIDSDMQLWVSKFGNFKAR